MGKPIYFVIDITPVPAPRMVKSDAWRKRPCVLRYWEFKDKLREECWKVGFVPGERLEAVYVLPMPKSWSKKKKREMNGKPHKQRPDRDNLDKAVQDCLNSEDSHIHEGVTCKRWGYKGKIVFRVSCVDYFSDFNSFIEDEDGVA